MIKQLEYLSKGKILVFIAIACILTGFVYFNHFHNDFHFDDSHTIQNNLFIQNIGNIPLFFKDGSTFSSLPSNQSYRPVVSASLAIDYWLGGGYNLFYFHLSTFILFLLQGILMFFVIFKILQLSFKNEWNFYIAAIASLWYLLHPANAETVNYIIARSDVQSTLAVVIAFIMYIFSPVSKKYFLYLIPVGIGVLAKPPAVMFAPLLFFYILLFEQNISLSQVFNFNKYGKQIIATIINVLPAFAFCIIMYLFVDHMTPETWQSGGLSKTAYLITQPFVILHYFTTLFFPFQLSADTDWQPLQSIFDPKFFIGIIFIIGMVITAFWCSKNIKYRPISFGIIWFFLALIPSSSIVPFAEVMNDHRLYFPYVGLIISVCWTIALLLLKIKKSNTFYSPIILSVCFLLLVGYGYGVIQRNKVWQTEESLWYDVTIKSPKNARGLMNYGLAKMSKGDYVTAEHYFLKALELWPTYSYLHVNLGVLKEATGDPQTAEMYFKNGLSYGSQFPDCWYFYGKFLCNKNRFYEAIPMLEKSIALSNAHIGARNELMRAYFYTNNIDKLKLFAQSTLQILPNNTEAIRYLGMINNGTSANTISEEEIKKAPTAEKYLQLSLQHYQNKNYEKSIEACIEAIKLKPAFAEAYNNIGSSYNMLGQYEKAIIACKKALEINPNFELAKNNLLLALNSSNAGAQNKKLTAEDYLNQSLSYYNQKMFEKCIEACNEAIKLKPNYADAYSNMCAAYNELKQWDKAIDACNKALQINPQHQLAKGNLNWAKTEKAKTK